MGATMEIFPFCLILGRRQLIVAWRKIEDIRMINRAKEWAESKSGL